MQIELNLPDSLVRKIKALSVMNGNKDLEGQISVMLEKTVDDAILSFIKGTPKHKTQHPYHTKEDFNFADSLGDQQDMDVDIPEELPPPVQDMYDLVPRGGLTEEILDDDMEVSDPEHEAKAEAPVDLYQNEAGPEPAEANFSRALGIDIPDTSDEYIDHRILKRRKNLNFRGKVTPANGSETE